MRHYVERVLEIAFLTTSLWHYFYVGDVPRASYWLMAAGIVGFEEWVRK